MNDQRDDTSFVSTDAVPQGRAIGVPATISRRAMLRGATATVPAILTLTSGAALARSSNLIGTTQAADGEVLCLDTSRTHGATTENPNVYDLGSPAYGEVTRIPDTDLYYDKNGDPLNPVPLTPAQVCRLDGTVQVQYDGTAYWVEKRTPGVMVSSAAVASFGTRIITTDI